MEMKKNHVEVLMMILKMIPKKMNQIMNQNQKVMKYQAKIQVIQWNNPKTNKTTEQN